LAQTSFPYIFVGWEVFTEPLPGNALIKSVALLLLVETA
jgi:hypothetical protein